MSIRPIIRKNARDSLRHHWGRAIGMLLFLICVNVLFLLLEQLFCYLLSLNIPEEPALVVDLLQGRLRLTGSMAIVTLTFAVVSFVLTTPLCFGMAKWYYHQVGGERPSLQILFTCFYSMKELWRSIALRILLAVRILFWRRSSRSRQPSFFWQRRLLAGWQSRHTILFLSGWPFRPADFGQSHPDRFVVRFHPALFSGGLSLRFRQRGRAARHDPPLRPDHEGKLPGNGGAPFFLLSVVFTERAGDPASLRAALPLRFHGHQRPCPFRAGHPEAGSSI